MEPSQRSWPALAQPRPSPKNRVVIILYMDDTQNGACHVVHVATWAGLELAKTSCLPCSRSRMFLKWNLVMALSILHPTWLLSSFLRVHSPVTLVSCQPLLPSILLSAHKWAEISCQLRLIFSLPSCINSSEMLIQMQLNSKAYCLTLFPVNPQKALWGRDDQIKMLSRRWCSRREKWFEVVSVPWYFY